jgi:hypothetical protein
MESWSARDDDRPYVPVQAQGKATWPWLAGAGLVLAVMTGAYYYFLLDLRGPAPVDAPAVPAPVAQAPAAPAAPEPAPAVRHPMPEAPPASLPTLDGSDAMARESLVDLLGRPAFDRMVIPVQLVRRIVATVDNLPRPTAPRRAIPLSPVPGAFTPEGGNAARYTPYVRVFESIDTGALVQRYVRTYPLFQRAYEELGFPGRYFNDRLIEAIDDLLAAPEPAIAPILAQSKVLYEFVDPELEGRSAGQKILLRMGVENTLRVKAKLREIRRELVALRRAS